jgi:ParB-like chromosome segregation protein Spo0J
MAETSEETELKIDHEFQDMLYPLESDELMALTESIKNEGCRDPIVVWNGIIIDGHNRYKICKAKNIPFKVMNKDFKTRDEATVWIMDNQLARRNLTPFQRTEINVRRKSIWERRAKANLVVSTGGAHPRPLANLPKVGPPLDTRMEIAKASGVSERQVSKVEKILEKGKPDDLESVRKGEISIDAAYKKVHPKPTLKPSKTKTSLICHETDCPNRK